MTPLANAIQSEQLTGSASEIAAAFAETVALPFNTELWTSAGVALSFGIAAAEGLGTAIRAAGMETMFIRYATIGIDLSLQQTQDGLSAIASEVPDLVEVCNALKAVGRPTAVRWQRAGLSALPSEQDVQAALDEIATREWWHQVRDELVPGLITSGASIAELKTAIGEAD